MQLVWIWGEIFKIFLNLERQHALQNQVRTFLCGQNEITEKHLKNTFCRETSNSE